MKKMTYNDWLRNWVNIYKRPYIKTWKRVKDTIRLHIPDSIKKMHLSELTALDIQKALNNVKSTRMRVETYDVYHGSLSMAYKIGFIDKDISALIIKPKHTRNIGSALTREELEKFLEDIKGHRYEDYYRFLLLTGCRRQEALDFILADIDVENNLLYIKGTKTEKSVRQIPVFAELYTVFPCDGHFGFVEWRWSFTDKFGYIKYFNFSASRISKEFKRLCPNHKLHDLRHTFATRCLECGISMKVVQTWLGHSRLDTTASIYSHVQLDFVKAESQKFKLL